MTRKELKHNFINGVMDLRDKGLVEQDCLLDLFEDVIEPCIAELETRCNELFLQTCEQAEKIKELREYNKYLRRKRQGGIQKQYNKVAIIKQQNEQLTKAKKIIRKLYSHVFQGMDFMELNDYNVQKAEVEQFLKENS